VIKRFLSGFFKKIVLLLNKILKAVLSVYVKLSIVLITYSVLLLLLKAIKKTEGLSGQKKGLFKADYKKKI
jgi:hypothetical protein